MITLCLAAALAAGPAPSAPATREEAPSAEQSVAPGPDRSAPPQVADPLPVTLVPAQSHQLWEGLDVDYYRVAGVRKLKLVATIERGAVDFDDRPLTVGVGQLMDAASARWGPKDLAREQDLREAEVVSSMRMHQGSVSLTVPVDRLDGGLDLYADVLRHPTFPKSEVKRLQRDMLDWYLTTGPTDPSAAGYAALSYASWPADHPYGARPDLDGLRGISSKALIARHAAWLGGAPIQLTVAGDLPWSELEPKLRQVFEGLGAPGPWQRELEVPALDGLRVIGIDFPGHPQTLIHLRGGGPTLDSPDHVAANAVDFALGGHFLSRLNLNLREEKGWTYGSRSSYVAWHERATWSLSVDVKVENTRGALDEIRHELDRLGADGVTPEELSAARNVYVSGYNGTQQTAQTTVGYQRSLWLDQLTPAQDLSQREQLATLSVAQTAEVARRWLGPDAPQLWVLVGDREAITAQLDGIGWQVEWHSPAQAILGDL